LISWGRRFKIVKKTLFLLHLNKDLNIEEKDFSHFVFIKNNLKEIIKLKKNKLKENSQLLSANNHS
jgi:hypothetical protein